MKKATAAPQFTLRTLFLFVLPAICVLAAAFASYREWRGAMVPVHLRRLEGISVVEVRSFARDATWKVLDREDGLRILRVMRKSKPWKSDGRFRRLSRMPFLGRELYEMRVTRNDGGQFRIQVGYPAFSIEGEKSVYVFPADVKSCAIEFSAKDELNESEHDNRWEDLHGL